MVLRAVAIWLVSAAGLLFVAAIAYLAMLGVQSRAMVADVGIVDGRLRACPSTPNCVCSDMQTSNPHYIAAIADPSGAKWRGLREAVQSQPGAGLVNETDDYLHFTFTSRLFGFVDDVEFHRRSARGEIAVRSASRVGTGDLNANRKRIEALRAAL